MEDGSNGASSNLDEVASCLKNGVVSPIMANFPEGTVAVRKEEKTDNNEIVNSGNINGDANNEEGYSSGSDALIIDESSNKQKSSNNSTSCDRDSDEVITHFNPYFNESLYELSQQHQNKQIDKKSKKNKPKLREYAQYLGLQPSVQFKCSKCGRSGFESLSTLNEHIVQCRSDPIDQREYPDNSYSSFKLTRKVFLCSPCGTYYENWNLYLHMLEVHKRYVCLYCLGMFSVLHDLCLHIQSKHNLEPGHKNNPDDFFSVYNEPCYLVCCDCNKLFNEQDNFFYHNCATKKAITINNKIVKKQIRPEDHVTGDSFVTEQKQNSIEDVTVETSEAAILIDNQVAPNPIIDFVDSLSDFKGFDLIETPHIANSDNELNDDNIINNLSQESDLIDDKEMEIEEEIMETRKVPKLSLKLKPGFFPEITSSSADNDEKSPEHIEKSPESDDIEIDENDLIETNTPTNDNIDSQVDDEKLLEISDSSNYRIAGSEVPIVELELEQPLDKFDIRVLLQKCLNATTSACIYCNHARKIAVNGKQLGLHAIGEHRFSAIVHSITAEELIPESFVSRIKESLEELDLIFFSLESNPSDEAVTFSHVFECFQCRYSTTIHKELYLHNRKLHTKNLLLCIMCKLNFYNYSELICHLCPGVYILNCDVQFRCCLCVGDDLPSAFRLMVHLRKKHNVCDVCLESCHSQNKLSNHVWKHKLHHFCYRCGIAYRNKPDITRHLFWKHGTESVLCKKCLQKKWPHVYHFCMPPATFVCDDCNLTFSRAVSLKVHKRLHSNDKPHSCTIEGCREKFISKKLLIKHELKHKESPKNAEIKNDSNIEVIPDEELIENKNINNLEKCSEKVVEKAAKLKVDVYDLPELNLSESDSSDSDAENEIKTTTNIGKIQEFNEATEKIVESQIEINAEKIENADKSDAKLEKAPIIEHIWDDFKNYQANKEKFVHIFSETDKIDKLDNQEQSEEFVLTSELALRDHDYVIDPNNKRDVSFTEITPELNQSVDHDYCSAAKTSEESTNREQSKINCGTNPNAIKTEIGNLNATESSNKSGKKRGNSSSSSGNDSDSSSCSCGSNCSCTSTSGTSSSTTDSSDSDSSTEEGRRRQQIRRDRRRQRSKINKKINDNIKKIDIIATDATQSILAETPICESDLETTESETDEEFYDKEPQKLAKKILEEKRNQLIAGVGIDFVPNGSFLEESRSTTPNLIVEEPKLKKKSKSKKKKKKKKLEKYQNSSSTSTHIPNYYNQYYQSPTVAPITLSRISENPTPVTMSSNYSKLNSEESDGNLRASKRRRVPNKFYGYSSDEDQDKSVSSPKWRKTEPQSLPHSSMQVVPPITIKTVPPVHQQQQPKLPPFSIRTNLEASVPQQFTKKVPPIRFNKPLNKSEDGDSGSDSNDSNNAEGRNIPGVNPDALYCYCKCPYDEVSEMIGCDSRDCSIEWFHFECVGIMVPPKGHWYCPECRKKRQQRHELLKMKAKANS